MELLHLGKSNLSRRQEELQNFRHCIRRLGRHIKTCVRKLCQLQDREVWETNLWEYACLYTVFDRLQLRILYRDSSRNFHSFKGTYERLRFNFLATQLLIGSCDLQQLYGAWRLCGACICSDCRLTSLNCMPQNKQMKREMSEVDARPDSRQGPSSTAVSRAKHHGGCSPDTQRHSPQSTSRPNTEGANGDFLEQR
ncbi:hypothetical protein SKAU_G00359080 [Synaphobranchus kaupii]|uniref:Chromodomain-helicase-DNA-binding protein 1-like C-terminal domain-containing protein n=1 Tax=Synaphobranchus kaupii TaxID=118154 RepID=A0A9Q1IGQ2_SYNKA|nr:hypothetical protein SKAU_G00359080 [Synaphobranchus kaupii]